MKFFAGAVYPRYPQYAAKHKNNSPTNTRNTIDVSFATPNIKQRIAMYKNTIANIYIKIDEFKIIDNASMSFPFIVVVKYIITKKG